MSHNDSVLLEKAYLSISQKMPSVPSDEETISTEPNEVVGSGPMDEPAPGTDTLMTGPEASGLGDEMGLDSGMPSDDMSDMSSGMGDDRLDVEDESEEDSMSIDNLNSIRESIMKIAKCCASGGHLEPWQQQKLAIAMDNLAGVARSLR
jgi:hypothetical protein